MTFTTTLASPTSASIKFGLDTSYGLTAPVDLTAASYRTLLLGMKASKTYHYQITVTNSSGSCSSADQMIATGALPNGTALPKLTITTNNKAALWGGFLVIGSYQGATNQSFILDADGDFVWWYADGSDGCGTRMSYDGKYMWINNGNVPATSGSTHVHRVTMDGMTDTDFSTPFNNMSHQVTPLPDGSVAFYATGSNGVRRHQDLPGERHRDQHGHHGGQLADRARRHRRLPRQQHRVLAGRRHAGLLGPRQRLPDEGVEDHRRDRLGPQRRTRAGSPAPSRAICGAAASTASTCSR